MAQTWISAVALSGLALGTGASGTCGPMPARPMNPEYQCEGVRAKLAACCEKAFSPNAGGGGLSDDAEISDVEEYFNSGKIAHCADYYSDWGPRFARGYTCARSEGKTGGPALCGGAIVDLCAIDAAPAAQEPEKSGAADAGAASTDSMGSGPAGSSMGSGEESGGAPTPVDAAAPTDACGSVVPPLPQATEKQCNNMAGALQLCCMAANPGPAKTFESISATWSAQDACSMNVGYDGGLWTERFKSGYECALRRGVSNRMELCKQAVAEFCPWSFQPPPLPTGPPMAAPLGETPTCGAMPPLPMDPKIDCSGVKGRLAACCEKAFSPSAGGGGLSDGAEISDVEEYFNSGKIAHCADYYSDWGPRFARGYTCARSEGKAGVRALCGAATNNLCEGQAPRQSGPVQGSLSDGAPRAEAGLTTAAAAAAWASIVATCAA